MEAYLQHPKAAFVIGLTPTGIAGASVQMLEDTFDVHWVLNTGNDVHDPTMVSAGLHVDPG